MADYGKVRASLVVSTASDYSDPYLETNFADFTFTPTEVFKVKVSAATTGTTIDLSTFTTVSLIMIKNLDTTNYVDMTKNYSSVNGVSRIAAKGILIEQSPGTIANDLVLTANTAACLCEVIIAGS
jgi:hypothetical protein